jgi:NitT/TauT family transport system permease protein
VRASYRRVSLGAAGLAAAFGRAELVVGGGRVDPALFPLPSTVLGQAVSLATNSAFVAAVGSTMVAWAEAMAVTVAIAVPAGAVLGMLPRVESALRPVIEFLRPLPSVVLVPLVLLIVQDDVGTEVVVIVFAAVWPVLINTVYGLREVDPEAKETLRSFGFGPLAVTWRVSLPSAAPFIATGIRIAASLAFVVAIAVELVGVGMNGLGAFAGQAQSGTDAVPVMIAVAIWAGIIGLAINAVFVGAERRAFRWHHVLSMTALSGART